MEDVMSALKFVLVFEKPIRICGWIGKVIGPFDTMQEANDYWAKALETWKDQEALANCFLESMISKDF